MKVILSHAGKQHAYHIAHALERLGYLEKFYTSSYISSARLQGIIEYLKNSYFSRRYHTGLSGKYVDANWRFELPEIVCRRLLGKTAFVENLVYKRDIEFDRYVSKHMMSARADIFWGFQGSCFKSLQAAKKAGKITICELATAHVTTAKRILGEEQALHPEWKDSIDNLIFPKVYEERLQMEPHEADVVIGASKFTVDSLLSDGVSAQKIKLLPLGFDIDHIPFNVNGIAAGGRPLKILYAGKITQRKGIKYLLEAVQMMGKAVELHLIGGIQGDGHALKRYKGSYIHHPAVSQQELFRRYQEYDVFVLPTLFEGFGLVILEAMAAGLPVITTPHSIGPDLIVQDKNGYIVPIRDVEAIKAALECILKKDPEALLEMKIQARKAAEHMDWLQYSVSLESVLKTL